MAFFESRDSTPLANLLSDDSAWERALAQTRGETMQEPEPEEKPTTESHGPSDLELFVHGYLLSPLGLDKSPSGGVRIICSSSRPQKRASFFAVFRELGVIHRITSSPYVDIEPRNFKGVQIPLTKSMFKNLDQYGLLLAGAIAGQKSFPGDHPKHRLTIASSKLLDDFVDNFEPHFGFSLGSHIEENDASKTLEYNYEPVRAALLEVEVVGSLRFINVALPPLRK